MAVRRRHRAVLPSPPRSTNPDTSRGDDPARNTVYTDKAALTYRYTVADHAYTGTMVSFGDYGSTNSAHAGGITSRYPAGQNVTVFYEPIHPDLAVLEPGLNWGVFLSPAIGLTFLIGGSVVAKLVSRAPL